MYSNEQLNAIHSSKIGFGFEFIANDNIDLVKGNLSNALNKRIRIDESVHGDFLPTTDTFKLIPNFSGIKGMTSLSTGLLPFVEAKLILSKTLKWIRENASTTDRCSLHVQISFDSEKLGPSVNISRLDVGKFVLNFDEDKVYDAFPDRKDTVYAKSIKFIMPFSGMTQTSPGKNMWKNYMFIKDKYYGVDFTGIGKGHIDFKYLGGVGYEKKYTTILSMIEHFIISLYDVLNNPIYSKEDLKKLDEVLAKHKDVVQAYKNYEIFKKQFPDISIMVDLKSLNQIVTMYYPKIREKIFDLLTKGGMKSGLINYDSDSGRTQIKDATLMQCFEISGVDIFECKVKGNIKHCDIFHSEIIDSFIFESNVFGMSECKDSKIEDSYISRNVEINNCYVSGTKGVFSGDMKGGIFKQGRATKFATFSDSTEVIEIEKINM
jgi:hypothetical protein